MTIERQIDALVLATIQIVQSHLHGHTRYFGKSGDQSGDDWGVEGGLTPYRAISGSGVFGGDADDEAKVLGTDDTPAQTGMTLFDPQEIVIESASNANTFVLRIIQGSGTIAAAESAGQYSDIVFTEAKKGTPVELHMMRVEAGVDKVWVKVKSATDNAWVDFFYGIHEYII